MVWVHPKTAKTVSSTTGAVVGAGSLKPPESKPDFLFKMFLGEKMVWNHQLTTSFRPDCPEPGLISRSKTGTAQHW